MNFDDSRPKIASDYFTTPEQGSRHSHHSRHPKLNRLQFRVDPVVLGFRQINEKLKDSVIYRCNLHFSSPVISCFRRIHLASVSIQIGVILISTLVVNRIQLTGRIRSTLSCCLRYN